MLAYWLYRSEALVEQKSSADGLIYLQARDHNAVSDITGYLHRDETVYVQYIEGPATALKTLQNEICVDGRHRNVEFLLCGTTPMRRFTSWDMSFTDEEILPFEAFLQSRNMQGSLADATGHELLEFFDMIAQSGLADFAARDFAPFGQRSRSTPGSFI